MAHRASQILSPKQLVRVWVSVPDLPPLMSTHLRIRVSPTCKQWCPHWAQRQSLPHWFPKSNGSPRSKTIAAAMPRAVGVSHSRRFAFVFPGLLCHPQSQTRDLASLTKTLACGQQPCSPLYSHLVRAAATTRTRSARCFVGTLI